MIILGALSLTEQLRQAAVASAAGKDADLDRFLADSANKMACHYDPEWPAELPPEVNWSMLCLLLGGKEAFLGSQVRTMRGMRPVASTERQSGPRRGREAGPPRSTAVA